MQQATAATPRAWSLADSSGTVLNRAQFKQWLFKGVKLNISVHTVACNYILVGFP
jgi:hypothetical protein